MAWRVTGMSGVYMRTVALLLLFALTGPVFPAFSAADDLVGSLKYVTENFPPFNFKTDDGPAGLAVDVLRLMWSEMGVPEREIEFLPWARGFDMASNQPGVVLFVTGRVPQRERLFKWVGPIARSRLVLVGLKGRGLKVDSPDDLKNYVIGVIKGYASDLLLKKLGTAERIEAIPKAELHFKKLLSGRVDLGAFNEHYFRVTAQEYGYDPDLFEVVWAIDELNPCFAFSRQTPDSVIDRFQKAFDKIRSRPEYQRSVERYLGTP